MNLLKEFFVITRSIDNKLSGECKLCRKHYSDKTGSTGNFHKHLKRKHFKQYQYAKCPDYVTREEEMIENEEELKDNVAKINRCILTELIIKCNLPPSIVEHVGFRNFLRILAPRWKPTSARYFTRVLLPKLITECQEKMREALNNVAHVSVTVDAWTDRRGRSFIGVTGHYLDENYVPQAILIDFVRLKRMHTGENIRRATVEILESWQIQHKVFRIITDNAAAMIKAYEFGLNITDDTTTRPQHNTGTQFNNHTMEYFDTNDLSSLAECHFIQWNDSEKSSDETIPCTVSRLSCFAHSLQLTIRDGLRETPYLSKSLLKCIQLARKSYKSSKITDILEDIGKTINRSNLTRWNSEYLLIKSIVALEKKTIDEITDSIDDDELKFNHHDILVLKEAVLILEPFTQITTRIQSETLVTISLVLPSIVHLIDHLKNVKQHISLLSKTCDQLEQSINQRFAGIVKRLHQEDLCLNDPFSDPIYFISAVLDPEFKLHWLRQMKCTGQAESHMKQSLIQMILNECAKETIHLGNRVDFVASPRLNTSEFKSRKLFDYDDYEDTTSSLQSILSPINEIDAYLSDPVRARFSVYWKNSQFSHLKSVVKRIFSVQASSAPIERVFSQAGLILSPRRTAMLEDILRSLVFLRVNQHFFQNKSQND